MFITFLIILNIYLSIYCYASVSLPDRVIIFGSSWWSNTSPTIGVYKAGSWSSLGQLKSTRWGYGAVEQAGKVMIVGGYGTE